MTAFIWHLFVALLEFSDNCTNYPTKNSIIIVQLTEFLLAAWIRDFDGCMTGHDHEMLTAWGKMHSTHWFQSAILYRHLIEAERRRQHWSQHFWNDRKYWFVYWLKHFSNDSNLCREASLGWLTRIRLELHATELHTFHYFLPLLGGRTDLITRLLKPFFLLKSPLAQWEKAHHAMRRVVHGHEVER